MSSETIFTVVDKAAKKSFKGQLTQNGLPISDTNPLAVNVVSGGGGGGAGSDRELVVTTYTVKTAFSGASVGDTITATQIIDVTATASTVTTIWRNQTTGLDIATPSAANLSLLGADGLTDGQLRASAVPVSIASMPSTPVTGPLTDAQLRATNVPVSIASMPSTPVTGPLTNTELRASAVPISAASLPLPSGAATNGQIATYSTAIVNEIATLEGITATETTLAALNAKVTAVDTGAVTVAASALPSGAATAAQQAAEITAINAVTTALGNPTPAGTNQIGTVLAKVKDGLGNDINSVSQGPNGNGLLVAQGGTNYFFSTLNSSEVQLASGATFTGAVESTTNSAAVSVLLSTDQPGILTLKQYIDASGVKVSNTWSFNIVAGVPFSRAFTLNGNYFNAAFQNTGASTTTTFDLDIAFGSITNVSNLGNTNVSINEINGIALNTGAQTSANSLPVVSSVETASGNITTQNLVPAGAATANSAVEITLNGNGGLGIQVVGTYTGALSLQGTINGTTWITLGGLPFLNVNTGGNLATITSALQGLFQADVGGFVKVRVTGLAAMTGTATVTLVAINSLSMVALDAALPTGANTIGAVNIAASQTLGTVTTVATVTASNNGLINPIADVASAALTTTTTTSAFTPTNGLSYEVFIAVTAATGTTPTLQVTVQESKDGGTNWYNVYAFPTITTSGTYASGRLPVTGNRVRYVQTVGGTTPSFTRSISRLQNNSDVFTPTASTIGSGGGTVTKLISAATTNATLVKAAPGQLYNIIALSTTASIRYLKLYNKASAPTVGTDVPIMTIPIPGNTAGAGVVIPFVVGCNFTTGISFAITGAAADNDTTVIAANDIILTLITG